MRFLVDECTGPAVARWLTELGHDVLAVHDWARGEADTRILERAVQEHRIIITNDKDFGDHVFRDRLQHCGVILLRLTNNRVANRIRVLDDLLRTYSDSLADRVVVLTDSHIRFASELQGEP